MKSIIYEIKRKLRRSYLILKYKINDGIFHYCHIIHVKPSDRGLGLTTYLIQEGIKHETPIVCPSEVYREILIQHILELGEKGILPKPILRQQAEKYIITPSNEYTRGRRYPNGVLIDNSCYRMEIDMMLQRGIRIRNGFYTLY